MEMMMVVMIVMMKCAGGSGLSFTPMVIDSHSGGWGKTARQTLDTIAKHVSACWRGEAANSPAIVLLPS